MRGVTKEICCKDSEDQDSQLAPRTFRISRRANANAGNRIKTTRRQRARRQKLDTDYSIPDELDANELDADDLDAEIIRRSDNSTLSN